MTMSKNCDEAEYHGCDHAILGTSRLGMLPPAVLSRLKRPCCLYRTEWVHFNPVVLCSEDRLIKLGSITARNLTSPLAEKRMLSGKVYFPPSRMGVAVIRECAVHRPAAFSWSTRNADIRRWLPCDCPRASFDWKKGYSVIK
jgi:hypothetical protein